MSSADQRADLHRQVARVAAFAAEKGIKVAKVVTEVGQGGEMRKGWGTWCRGGREGPALAGEGAKNIVRY